MDDREGLRNALADLCKDYGLTEEQQYRRIIQALVRQIGRLTDEPCLIAPHDLIEHDFLSHKQDERGNIFLHAPKTTSLGINNLARPTE